jgi:hypothetical protein
VTIRRLPVSLWVRGGLVESPLREGVAFELFASNADSEGLQSTTKDPTGLVGLFEHKSEPRDRCFGIIGASNRACTKFVEDCDIGTHKSKKTDIELGSVRIRCPLRENCIFITPSVNVLKDEVPDCVLEFLHGENRSVDAQVQLLSSLPSEDELLDEDVQEKFQDIHQQNASSVQFGRTPAKQKLSVTRYWDDDLAGAVESNVAGSEGLGMFKKIRGIISNMEEIQEEEFGASPAKSSMYKSVAELASLIQVQGDAIKGVEKGTNAMTSRVEAGVVGLKADVGSRPSNSDELPGLQLWEIIGNFSRRLDSMVGEVNRLEARLVQESTTSRALGVELSKSSVMASEAMAEASRMESVVVKLEGKVGMLEARLVTVKTDAANTQALALLVQDEVFKQGQSVIDGLDGRVRTLELRRGGFSGVGGPVTLPLSTVPGSVDTDAEISSLVERVTGLEDTTASIRSSLGGDTVMVGSEAHHSPDDLTEWVIKNISSRDNCPTKMIVDVVILLEQLQDVSKSSDAKMTAKAQARKSGFLNLALARTITSYSVLIPAAFGGGTEEDSLFKIKTYQKWSDPRKGFLKLMTDKVTLWSTGYASELRVNYPASKYPILNSLLANLATMSTTFFTQMSTFVTQFYLKLTSEVRARPYPENKSEQKEFEATLHDTEAEAWNLIMAFITDVFHELSMRRADGVSAESMDEGSPAQFATALFASMRAIKYCQELMDKEFEKHPTMAPTFNGFLFAERASKSDFRRSERRIGDLVTEIAGLQSKMDKIKK